MDTNVLFRLLDVCGLSYQKNLPSILEVTQKNWLRSKYLERWDLKAYEEPLNTQIIEIAKDLGFIEEIKPAAQYFDYCFMHGGPVSCMQYRLEYLMKLWKEGVRFKELIFLAGERALDKEHEKAWASWKTEAEAIHFLWDHASGIVKEMKEIKNTFIEVPMVVVGETIRRPNTQDTILKWLTLKLPIGKCLFISSQPFCKYQHAVAVGSLTHFPYVETVGPFPEEEDRGAMVILDSVTRWLYQEASNGNNLI